MMEKLVVLDYSTCTVHVHNIEREDPITDEYLDDLGYDSSECYWMEGDIEIIHHKGVLK
jgi:hypothetical protein